MLSYNPKCVGEANDVRIMCQRERLQTDVLQAHEQGQGRQGLLTGGDGLLHDQPGVTKECLHHM